MAIVNSKTVVSETEYSKSKIDYVSLFALDNMKNSEWPVTNLLPRTTTMIMYIVGAVPGVVYPTGEYAWQSNSKNWISWQPKPRTSFSNKNEAKPDGTLYDWPDDYLHNFLTAFPSRAGKYSKINDPKLRGDKVAIDIEMNLRCYLPVVAQLKPGMPFEAFMYGFNQFQIQKIQTFVQGESVKAKKPVPVWSMPNYLKIEKNQDVKTSAVTVDIRALWPDAEDDTHGLVRGQEKIVWDAYAARGDVWFNLFGTPEEREERFMRDVEQFGNEAEKNWAKAWSKPKTP